MNKYDEIFCIIHSRGVHTHALFHLMATQTSVSNNVLAAWTTYVIRLYRFLYTQIVLKRVIFRLKKRKVCTRYDFLYVGGRSQPLEIVLAYPLGFF